MYVIREGNCILEKLKVKNLSFQIMIVDYL